MRCTWPRVCTVWLGDFLLFCPLGLVILSLFLRRPKHAKYGVQCHLDWGSFLEKFINTQTRTVAVHYHRDTPTVWNDSPARETSTKVALVTLSAGIPTPPTILQLPVLVALKSSTLFASSCIKKKAARARVLTKRGNGLKEAEVDLSLNIIDEKRPLCKKVESFGQEAQKTFRESKTYVEQSVS